MSYFTQNLKKVRPYKTYDKKFDPEIRNVKDYARRVRFLVYKGFETVHVKAVMGEWDNQ